MIASKAWKQCGIATDRRLDDSVRPRGGTGIREIDVEASPPPTNAQRLEPHNEGVNMFLHVCPIMKDTHYERYENRAVSPLRSMMKLPEWTVVRPTD